MNAWLLARKDLLVTRRDKVALGLAFLLPIALATVFGFAMGAMADGSGPQRPRVELLVEDRDASDASAALVAALEASSGLRVRRIDTARVEAGGDGSARARVAKGDAPAGLLVPAGFGASAARGEPPGLVLYRDPGATLEQELLAVALVPALFDALGEDLAHRAMTRSLDLFPIPDAGRERAHAILERSWQDMDTLMREVSADGTGGKQEEPGGGAADGAPGFDPAALDLGTLLGDVVGLQVEDVVGGGDAEKATHVATSAHAVAGIAVMMLLFGLVGAGGSLLDEEAQGTLDRLLIAPGAARSVLSGKFLYCWILGLAQLAVLFLFAALVFRLPLQRAPAALVLHSLFVAGSATGFGILFAVACRSRKQLEGVSTLVILAMSALGGAWWPLAITPEWYQHLAHFTLTAWAMDGYQAIFWYDRGLAGVLLPDAILAAIALATGLAAALLWRRRARRT